MSAGECSSGPLLRTLWRPSLLQNQKGEHIFCRLLLQLMLQPQVTSHPLSLEYTPTTERNLIANTPTQVKMRALLIEHFNALPFEILVDHMLMLKKLILVAVVEYDNARLVDKKNAPTEFDIEPLLDMCIPALNAPVGAAN